MNVRWIFELFCLFDNCFEIDGVFVCVLVFVECVRDCCKLLVYLYVFG